MRSLLARKDWNGYYEILDRSWSSGGRHPFNGIGKSSFLGPNTMCWNGVLARQDDLFRCWMITLVIACRETLSESF